MKAVRKIIKIDEELCDGCGKCVPDCAEGSLQIVDGKAKLVADNLCDGLGACLGSCPTGALQIIEREADDFDEEAVEKYLEELKKEEEKAKAPTMECGCASSHIQSFPVASKAGSSCQSANIPTQAPKGAEGDSELSHWPIQIRLVPPHAPFLQNSDLLVAADCTAVAVKNFQQNYLKNKTVMMGCPKFDDAQSYIEKFADVLRTANLKSLTVLIMEVPCCSAMKVIIKKAIEQSGISIPVEEVVISTRGQEIERQSW